jgi:DNA-directed RNA polymerase subunit RPC12/RpoP
MTIANKAKSAFSKLSILEQFKEDRIRGNTIVFGHRDEPVEKTVEIRPLTYIFSLVTIPTAYLEGVSGSTPKLVNLHYGHNEIRIDPPSDFYNRHGGSVALDIECDFWERYPRGHRVAKAIEQNSRFSKHGISMVAGVTSRPHFRGLYLPSERESLKLFFEGKGFEIRPSKIEQYSNAVIDLVGGLDGVSILASKHAYNLLNVLALKSSKKVAQRIVSSLGLEDVQTEDISQVFRELEIAPELKGIPRTYPQLRDDSRIGLRDEALLALLDSLSKAQVLKRGFYVSCPNCGTPNWYPLQSISEYLTCPGCSFRFILPARAPDSPRSEMQWRYRLNTLVNRVVDQDALVGVLALYHLSRESATACHSFGLELCREGKPITDFDFLFVSKQEVYAGECKAGRRIGDKNLKTARLAAELGFAEFYFCTVDQFEDETLSSIQELRDALAEDGLQTKVNVLSGNDLLQESH